MNFFEDAEKCANITFVVGLIFATVIIGLVLVISAIFVPSATKAPTTRRFTHAEAKEQAKKLKLQEAELKEQAKELKLQEGRLQQLEEQKEKLGKNLEKKEEENRKLVTEGRKKDRAVEDLQDRLREAMSGRRHTACLDRLAYVQDVHRDDIARICRIHAEQTDQQCKRHAEEMAEEKTRANDDYRKLRGPLEQARDSAWVQLDKITHDMSILEAKSAQREADLASENDSLRSQLRARKMETEDGNNRNAILRRELELKDKEFAEQTHVLANTTQLLQEKTASADEESSRRSAELIGKDEKLKEALVQIEQVRNDQAEELRNALACVKQLEDDKSVLLKERYPAKPQTPEREDAEMVDVDVDIEDSEMTELTSQIEAQLRYHFANQLQAWQSQKESEIRAWKMAMVGVFQIDGNDPRWRA